MSLGKHLAEDLFQVFTKMLNFLTYTFNLIFSGYLLSLHQEGDLRWLKTSERFLSIQMKIGLLSGPCFISIVTGHRCGGGLER